ncbi:MAG: hypothetical protein M1834_005533 [Cirrosporium novae-zelandiae]|nr:MAG: hypothetical protein M1834_005533 [Cirrosporium novae-zelandiae]
MLTLSLRAMRPSVARMVRQRAPTFQRTFIAPTAVRRADLVQDLYLKELRNYKPAPVKPNDAEGHVQKFSPPKTPVSPEESDIAKDLKAYEEQTVEVEGQAATGETTTLKDDDWWEEDEEEEEAAHGH